MPSALGANHPIALTWGTPQTIEQREMKLTAR